MSVLMVTVFTPLADIGVAESEMPRTPRGVWCVNRSQIAGARPGQRVAALAITLVAALAYGPLGLLALAAAFGMTAIYGAWCREHLGGITGDLLGAGNELIEIVLLLAAATIGTRLPVYTGWGWILVTN